jgi:hypothetical protein
MRKMLYTFWVIVFTALMAIPVFAESTGAQTTTAEAVTSSRTVIIEAGGASDADLDLERYGAWEFRSSYPSVAAELRRNPRLAGSFEFVNRHPELEQLFESNAGLQQDILSNPCNYLAHGQSAASMWR